MRLNSWRRVTVNRQRPRGVTECKTPGAPERGLGLFAAGFGLSTSSWN